MAKPVLDDLIAEVTNATSVMESATVFIKGSAARTQAAIDAALALGATAEELAPIQAEVNAQRAASSDLAAAVVANTPAAPTA
jgi:hypothetical protein